MDFLLEALDADMMTEEYIYLTYWFHPEMDRRAPWLGWEYESDPVMMRKIKKAFTSVKLVSAIIACKSDA